MSQFSMRWFGSRAGGIYVSTEQFIDGWIRCKQRDDDKELKTLGQYSLLWTDKHTEVDVPNWINKGFIL